MKSTLTKSQKKTVTKQINNHEKLVIKIRFDDECGNGHNTFVITADHYDSKYKRDGGLVACGCLHDEIVKYATELEYLIKWHLCSTDGPMHYIENSLYHAKAISKHQGQWFVYIDNPDLGIRETLLGIHSDETLEQIKKDLVDIKRGYRVKQKEYFNGMAKDAELDKARKSAIWPNAELSDFTEEKLKARLPALIEAFRADMEGLGFTW